MLPLRLPRHACTPRDTARAGDLWRVVQDAAVNAAADSGWPPARFRTLGTGFVVRELRGVHLREAAYGELLHVHTQVADHKRAVMMRRETQIEGILLATADWVHIGPDGAPQRASESLIADFPVTPAPPSPVLPDLPMVGVPLPDFGLTPWWTEMDPLAHTNHPRYIDWADEALSRALYTQGLDPIALVPLAEHVRFRAGAKATDQVTVTGFDLGPTHVGGRSGRAFRFRARRGAPSSDAPAAPAETVADMLIIRGHPEFVCS